MINPAYLVIILVIVSLTGYMIVNFYIPIAPPSEPNETTTITKTTTIPTTTVPRETTTTIPGQTTSTTTSTTTLLPIHPPTTSPTKPTTTGPTPSENNPPTLISSVAYTDSTNEGEDITFWCDFTDEEQNDSTLDVRLWIGTCEEGNCFESRDWEGLGIENESMKWDATAGKFKYGPWIIPWVEGTPVAATCIAFDDEGLASEWGDKYSLFTVTSIPTTPHPPDSDTITIYFDSSDSAYIAEANGEILHKDADATETINMALDYISGGGKVFIERGLYPITQLTIQHNGTWLDSDGATLQAQEDAKSMLYAKNKSHLKITNLKFDANGVCRRTIRITGTDDYEDIRIDNVETYNTSGTRIWGGLNIGMFGAFKVVRNVHLSNLYIHDHPYEDEDTISLGRIHGLVLESSTFENLGKNVLFYGGSNHTIFGNKFYNMKRVAIHGSNAEFFDNEIKNADLWIRPFDAEGVQPDMNDTVDVTISDNEILNGSIELDDAINGISDILIKKTHITESGKHGIKIKPADGGGISDITIKNCTIELSYRNGVKIKGGDNIKIIDSIIKNNNQIHLSAIAGINIENGTDILIDGCQIYDSQLMPTQYKYLSTSGGEVEMSNSGVTGKWRNKGGTITFNNIKNLHDTTIALMKVIIGDKDEEYLRMLKDLGFDTIDKVSNRLFEGQNPSEDVYDFDRLERRLSMYEEIGLKVIPTLDLWNPPEWFKEKFPDCMARNITGGEVGLYNFPDGIVSNFWLAKTLQEDEEASTYLRNYIREFFQVLNRHRNSVVGVNTWWRGFRGRYDHDFNFGYFDTVAQSEWNYDFEMPATYDDYKLLDPTQQDMFKEWVIGKSGEVFSLLFDEIEKYMHEEDWIIVTMHYWGDHRRANCTGLDTLSFSTFLGQVSKTGHKQILFCNDAASSVKHLDRKIETKNLVHEKGLTYCNIYNIKRGNRTVSPLKPEQLEIPIEDFKTIDYAVNPDVVGMLSNGEALEEEIIKDIIDRHKLQ